MGGGVCRFVGWDVFMFNFMLNFFVLMVSAHEDYQAVDFLVGSLKGEQFVCLILPASLWLRGFLMRNRYTLGFSDLSHVEFTSLQGLGRGAGGCCVGGGWVLYRR